MLACEPDVSQEWGLTGSYLSEVGSEQHLPLGACSPVPFVQHILTNRGDAKTSEYDAATGSDCGFCTLQGARKSQEDNFVMLRGPTDVWGVFDGHRGHSASTYAANSFTDFLQVQGPSTDTGDELVQALRQLDFNMRSSGLCNQSGTTACVGQFAAGKLTVANLGDSRAVLVASDASVLLRTTDHNLLSTVEVERLEGCRANVEFDRLNGELNVTRSLGDYHLKKGTDDATWHMSNVADVYQCSPSAGDFVVLATDGLWDVMTDQEVAEFCAPLLLSCHTSGGCGDGTPRNPCQSVAESLVQYAVHDRRSCDNVTAIVVRFK